jgi:phosphate transport system permease protein
MQNLDRFFRHERYFHWLLTGAAGFIVIVLFLFFMTLVVQSWPGIVNNGFGFLSGTIWDAVVEQYGALPVLIGTLATSFVALIISIPFSISIALFLGQYFRKGAIASALRTATELLAGIPSVVYGFWGLFVLVPVIRWFEIAWHIIPFGVGVFTAALILAIMIIPYSASIAREVIQMVPQDLQEAAYSLGATKYEVMKHVVLPYAKSGILAGILLSFGRALGETMAVTMVIGNANKIPRSLFDTGNTMASIIANELAEATKAAYVGSLIEIGLLLFVVTALINWAGRSIIKKASIQI